MIDYKTLVRFVPRIICVSLCVQLFVSLFTACSDDSKDSTTDPLPWEYGEDMDEAVLPGDDFYSYALGGWLKTATLPEGREIYGINEEAYEKQMGNLNELLASTDDPAVRKMREDAADEALTEQNSINALKKHLKIVQEIRSEQDLLKAVGSVIRLGYSPFFNVGTAPADEVFVPYLYAGYTYYKKPALYQGTSLDRYSEWIAFCFQMLGYNEEEALRKADNIIRIERYIVACVEPGSYSLKYWSNADNYSRLKKVAQLGTKASRSDFEFLVAEMGLDPQLLEILEQAEPILDLLFEQGQDWEALRDYMENCVIQANRDYLPLAFRQEMAEVFEQDLLSADVLANNVMKDQMPYHLSKLYVEKYVDPSYKQKGTEMAEDMREVFKRRIGDLDWMSETTKGRAVSKLEAMVFNMAYPDTWDELGSPDLSGDCFCADVMQCREQTYRFNTSLFGKSKWEASWEYIIPQCPLYVVNAFYFPPINALVLPVAIMLPPMYDLSVSDAFNYATIGATTIGHEMTHGFDNNGSQFNRNGVVEDWWTLSDKLEFAEKQDAFIKCFNALEVIPGLSADGKNTLGENIADLGGLEIARQAFMEKKEREGFKGAELEDQEKKFYLSFAQAWKAIYTDEHAQKMTATDVHSLPKLRVNGIVNHTDAWYDLFGAQWGDRLFVKEDMRVHIW